MGTKGFLYFVTGEPAAGPPLLKEIGLAATIGEKVATGRIDNGPGGGAGVLVVQSRNRPDMKMRYDAAAQTWWPAGPKDTARYWIGLETAAKPTAQDLRRPGALLPGEAVTLSDGSEWIVPMARMHLAAETPAVGPTYGLAADGEIQLALGPGREIPAGSLAEFVALEQLALEVWADQVRAMHQVAMDAGDEIPDPEDATKPITLPPAMSDRRRLEIAAAVLAANYHVGLYEVAALGICSLRDVGEILGILVDTQGFLDLLNAEVKKNSPSGT